MNQSHDTMALFAELSAFPRTSGHEQAVTEWLLACAKKYGWKAERDAARNVLIHVPATPGCENAPTVMLQAHTDMVAAAEPETKHDFLHDPVSLVTDGDWVRADGTSLGADNGIGIALALSLTMDPMVTHGPLALLFTADEEVGMGGARGVAREWVTAPYCINLDSEDEGVFIVGCAGGQDVVASLAGAWEKNTHPCYRIMVEGLTGGHSGLEIHRHRANAVALLAAWLERMCYEGDVRLVTLQGGTARNAIPASAYALFSTDLSFARLEAIREDMQAYFSAAYPEEMLCRLELESAPAGEAAHSVEVSRRMITTLLALPCGVGEMVEGHFDLVQTSNNISPVLVDQNGLTAAVMVRSLVDACARMLVERVEAVIRLAGGHASRESCYPAWQPVFDAPLARLFQEMYQKRTGKDARVEVIHAGLECGVLCDRLGIAQAISAGPDIRSVHTPHERCHVPSVLRTRDFLADCLAALAKPVEV